MIGRMGISRLNFSTDDPWNPAFRARWFLDALPLYDTVFSARCANIADLEKLGRPTVRYMPFGFDPQLCYPERADAQEIGQLSADVLFVGGADRDRVPLIAALGKAAFSVALYGDYWKRFPETRRYCRGYADPNTFVKPPPPPKSPSAWCAAPIAMATSCAASKSPPSAHACWLRIPKSTARSSEPDGEAVVYFRSVPEMIDKARWLLDRPAERQRLAAAAHARIVAGRHTYQDRLAAMLGLRSNHHEDRYSRPRPLSCV